MRIKKAYILRLRLDFRDELRRVLLRGAGRCVACRAALRAVFRALRRRTGAPRSPLVTERIIEATAASAAAIAAAVAARAATFCTYAAVSLAAPTTRRWVFCTKLRLAMTVSEINKCQ
jgi:hypothetical protein